jgi:hypothetical protein
MRTGAGIVNARHNSIALKTHDELQAVMFRPPLLSSSLNREPDISSIVPVIAEI